MRPMDTSEAADEVQLGIYRRMEPSERLQVGLDLTELSRQLLAEGIRQRHPEYDDEQVRLATIRAWLGADLFFRVYPGAPALEP